MAGERTSTCLAAVVALAAMTAAPAASAQEPAREIPAAAAAEQEAAVVKNVAGHWELNWRASDRPSGVVQQGEEGRGEPRPGGGGPPPGGGGMGGRGGMMGRGGGRGGERPERRGDDNLRERLRELLTPARTLLIIEHPDAVTITDEHGGVEKIRPTGAWTKDEQAAKPLEQRAHWDGRALVSEVVLSDGTTITRRFQKAAEGLQLLVITKVDKGRLVPPMEMKRVYDQALQEK